MLDRDVESARHADHAGCVVYGCGWIGWMHAALSLGGYPAGCNADGT